MIHGDMTRYSNGRKKKYNAWSQKSPKQGEFVEMKSSYTPPPRRGATQANMLKSVVTSEVHTTKVEAQKYTGTLVKGISTMHKSNAVPIINEDEAKEHARMRR